MDDTKIYYLENTTASDITICDGNLTISASSSITLFDKSNISTSYVYQISCTKIDDDVLNENISDGSLVFKEDTTSKTASDFYYFIGNDFIDYDYQNLLIKSNQIRIIDNNTKLMITDVDGNNEFITLDV